MKYVAAVGAEDALRMRAHTVSLRFSNLVSTKNLSSNLLAKLCGVALNYLTHIGHFDLLRIPAHHCCSFTLKVQPIYL